MPKRIQRKRTKGWRMPENCVYVGRPTKWGNPFRTVQKTMVDDCFHGVMSQYRSHATFSNCQACVDFYLFWMTYSPESMFLRFALQTLRGKDLCCWCPLDKPCHADVLLELANRE